MLVSRRNASDGLDRHNNVYILTSREPYLSIHANMYIQSRQRYSVTVQSIVSIQRPHLSWPLVSICILDHNVLICLQTTYFRWTTMQQPSTSGVTTHVINLHAIDLSFLCILFLRTVHQWCCNCWMELHGVSDSHPGTISTLHSLQPSLSPVLSKPIGQSVITTICIQIEVFTTHKHTYYHSAV